MKALVYEITNIAAALASIAFIFTVCIVIGG